MVTSAIARRRFTADEYQRLGEIGFLHEDEHIELIDGELVQMAAAGNKHVGCVTYLNRVFVLGAPDLLVSVQNPLRLTPYTEPEPDLVVLRPRADGYFSSRPTPEDALLVVEVADSSLRYDRDVKRGLYAAAGVPELWIANLVGPSIISYREPKDGRYERYTVYRRGSTLSPLLVPQIRVSVSAALGLDVA